jgi:hypothetical protein
MSFPEIMIDIETLANTPRQGTHHNALDDAIYQAEYVMKIHGLITDLHQDG